MKIAILSQHPAEIAKLFVERHRSALEKNGIKIGLILIDENQSKEESFFSHALKIARRQAQAAGCSTAMGFAKIVTYKIVTKLSKFESELKLADFSDELPVHRVGSLNSKPARLLLSQSDCDLVCLMGSRILTKKTLDAIAKPVVNIHTSDPRFMRGSPGVVWEVLDGRKEIVLTIHRVTESLDSGDILKQASHPIRFGGGLGRTFQKTLDSALPLITDLFFEVVLQFKNKTATGEKFSLGPLRVTPSLFETLRAEILCRKRGI